MSTLSICCAHDVVNRGCEACCRVASARIATLDEAWLRSFRVLACVLTTTRRDGDKESVSANVQEPVVCGLPSRRLWRRFGFVFPVQMGTADEARRVASQWL